MLKKVFLNRVKNMLTPNPNQPEFWEDVPARPESMDPMEQRQEPTELNIKPGVSKMYNLTGSIAQKEAILSNLEAVEKVYQSQAAGEIENLHVNIGGGSIEMNWDSAANSAPVDPFTTQHNPQPATAPRPHAVNFSGDLVTCFRRKVSERTKEIFNEIERETKAALLEDLQAMEDLVADRFKELKGGGVSE